MGGRITGRRRTKNLTPADIINLSLSGPGACDGPASGRIGGAIEKARSAGAVIVVAAGNGKGDDHIPMDMADYYPANCPGVISVAAHDHKGHLSSYSNFGNVSIVAPGGDTDVPVLGIGGTGTLGWSGTSQATPHVAAAIALAMAQHEELRRHPDLVATAIHDSAVPMPAGACAHPCGPGQLDAQKLLEYVPRSSKPPLTSSITPPPQVSPHRGRSERRVYQRIFPEAGSRLKEASLLLRKVSGFIRPKAPLWSASPTKTGWW